MKKNSVDAQEFTGGYSLVRGAVIETVIRSYRDGSLKKDELRVFAGLVERSALHEKSRVDLARILNAKSSSDGVKRLRVGIIKRAEEKLSLTAEVEKGNSRRKCISRKALRAIAQGRLSCTESVVLLMYFLKRITQSKPLKRLEEGERYARFTYRELEELSGVSRANVSRAVASLKAKGFIANVWVVKPNENQFGLLFVDGPLLTLTKGAHKDRSKPEVVNKSTTPPAQKSIAPMIERATLRKIFPKRDIPREKGVSLSLQKDSEWERILQRAKQMRENLEEQAA